VRDHMLGYSTGMIRKVQPDGQEAGNSTMRKSNTRKFWPLTFYHLGFPFLSRSFGTTRKDRPRRFWKSLLHAVMLRLFCCHCPEYGMMAGFQVFFLFFLFVFFFLGFVVGFF